MSNPGTQPRNPGPRWGFAFVTWAERSWPEWFFAPLLHAGSWVTLALLPRQRAASRAYLATVFGRPARWTEVGRHFHAFGQFLAQSLRAGRGGELHCTMVETHAAEFESLVRSDEPALFGSFHFGSSDLLGYLLAERGRTVTILRQRVGNSDDTRQLGARYGDKVTFLWVNDPARLLFDLKDAIQAGKSLALKCDRLEFSGKTEGFRFLGTERSFPFTIYHLAVLFERPVVFCLALPGATRADLTIYSSPVFRTNPTASRSDNLARAREHFQAVLNELEGHLRRDPYLWFNFLPLNPPANAREVTAPPAL